MNVKGLLAATVPLLLGAVLTSLPAAPVLAQGLTEVKVALGWLRNGQYAALMVADSQGYFAEEGLSISFIDGGPGKNSIPVVGVGQAHFGITPSPNVFLARAAPDPVDIVAIGALGQEFPFAYMTLTERGAPAPTPQDLVGKSVGIQADGDFYLDALLDSNGVDRSALDVQTVLATPEPLIIGKVQYFAGMLNNQPHQIEQEIAKATDGDPLMNKVVQHIKFVDVVTPAFGDVIFTSRKVIDEDPDTVTKFLRAVAKGVKYTIDAPAEAAALVAKYDGQIEDEAKIAWRLDVQNPLAESADTAEHGYLWMNRDTWAGSIALWDKYGLLSRPVTVDEVMTNEFNPGVN